MTESNKAPLTPEIVDSETKPTAAKPKSTRRALAAMLVAFESFVVFFATLVAFGLKVADPAWVWGVGLTLSILLILSPGIFGRPGSYVFGWVLQAAVLLTGIWVPLMWILGGIFVCLYAWAMIAGSTIDRAREAYLKGLQDNL